MDHNHTSIHAILNAREARWQQRLTLARQQQASVVCLGLNMPGVNKNPPGSHAAWAQLAAALEQHLAESGIRVCESFWVDSADGRYGLWAVKHPAEQLKRLALRLETEHPLGRLADFDVIDPAGQTIGRAELGLAPRQCLICTQPAAACVRSRQHTLQEIGSAIQGLFNQVAI